MNREIVLKGNSSMGDFWSDAMTTIFGDKGVEKITTTAQTAATNVVVNTAGKYIQNNPEASKTVENTVMTSVNRIWSEYKVPVIAVGVIASAALLYGVWSMIYMHKTASGLKGVAPKKKSNPRKTRLKKRRNPVQEVEAEEDEE